MKAALVALLMTVAVAWAVDLEWDASVGPDVVGYRVKYGYASGVYSTVVEIGPQLTATVNAPWPVGTVVYFAAYAYNSEGAESLPSNEVSYTVQPPPPPPPTPTPTPMPTPGAPQRLRIKLTLTISMTNQWEPGSFVKISAPKAAPGFRFDRWVGDVATLDNFMDRTPTVTMPKTMDVYLQATYKKL